MLGVFPKGAVGSSSWFRMKSCLQDDVRVGASLTTIVSHAFTEQQESRAMRWFDSRAPRWCADRDLSTCNLGQLRTCNNAANEDRDFWDRGMKSIKCKTPRAVEKTEAFRFSFLSRWQYLGATTAERLLSSLSSTGPAGVCIGKATRVGIRHVPRLGFLLLSHCKCAHPCGGCIRV